MADARAARLARLRDALTAAHVDALLVSGRSNIRYLTGFSGSNALLVVSQADVLLFSDYRYETQAAAEAGAVARVVIESQSLWTGLWRDLVTLGGVQTVALSRRTCCTGILRVSWSTERAGSGGRARISWKRCAR